MDPLVLDDLVRPQEGLVSGRIFTDPEIYRLEQERIFGKTWLYVAHESEIPRPGDFVTRQMGEDPVIVCRGRDGKVRVFLNVCRHRGRRICGQDAGATAKFICGYHGWTYSDMGELIAVPFVQAYKDKLDKNTSGLYQAVTGSYHGLVFATWNSQAEPLDEYLGPMKWILDLLFGRTEGVEVLGAPVRWLADTNWKLGAANFTGDGFHVFTTHGFSTQLGLHELKATGGPPKGFYVSAGNGHAASLVGPAAGGEQYLGVPRELWPEMERKLTKEQLEVARSLIIIAANVFPNLSMLQTAGHTPQEWGGPEGQPISFLTLRQWQPRGPEKMEGLTWLFVDKNATASWKEWSKQCYHRVFGVAGIFEQDDLENWAEITAGLRGNMAKQLWLHYEVGLDIAPSKEWPGPGNGYFGQPPFSDLLERVFYKKCIEMMQG
jgi:phenylpropionate dioxygenase-like ring-hydroxylating dioxygenase large terminal subunit